MNRHACAFQKCLTADLYCISIYKFIAQSIDLNIIHPVNKDGRQSLLQKMLVRITLKKSLAIRTTSKTNGKKLQN